MKNNGNGQGSNSNSNQGKPHLFKSLDTTNVEQTSLLGMHPPTAVSRTHQVSRISAQFVDFFLALYIMATQLPPTR